MVFPKPGSWADLDGVHPLPSTKNGKVTMTPMVRHSKRSQPSKMRALGLYKFVLLTVAAALAVLPASAQRERPALNITGYVIDAELDTTSHHLTATTVVSFTAPPNLDVVNFGFHPALKVTKITDETGKLLDGERTADGSIRVTADAPFVAGQTVQWTFVYDGTITGNEDGPIEGLKLAAIQEPISYLLYPARWFPMTGYMTDRFTAEMHIRVPQGMRVFATGATGMPKSVTLSSGKPGDEYDFNWTKPGFPGTVIAGRFADPFTAGPGNVKVYLTISHQASGNQLAQTATKEFDFFTDSFGEPESTHLNVVELPDDTLPAVWAPELAAIPARASATNPASACWPTPSPTSGGAAKSAPAPSTTPGSPTACPATAS